VKDLKGKTVAVPGMGTDHHLVVVSVAAYIGLDRRSDITFVTPATAEAMQLLAEGKIDAMMGFPPEPPELRPRKIGHVVVNMTTDRPWSQYFCCMLASNWNFVRRHPVATKRAVRLLEAGSDYPDPTHLPDELKYDCHQAASQAGALHNWSFLGQATPQQPRRIAVPRGKAVVGTSAVNHQIFLRGLQEDYDGCAALGNHPRSGGVGAFPLNKADGIRMSTALTYLPSCRHRIRQSQ
jgi:hypothetical protein